MKQLLLILLIFPIISFSQCPPNGTFNSQAEIDALATNYPDCTQLGGLIIEGGDITDLSGLNQITNATLFRIINNPLLQTLDGINPTLAIYSYVEIFFVIENNASLEDVTAITNISLSSEWDTNITIKDNPMLTSLNGLQNIGSTRTTSIVNNDALINLVGISHGIYFLIDDNDNLIDLNGLPDFDGDSLTITNNVSLQSFNMQDQIIAGYLTIINNPNLTDIDFPDNSGVWAGLTIENNTNLSVCNVNFVCQFFGNIPPQFINISNNLPGCNSIIEVEYTCGIVPFNDDCEFDFNGYLDEYFIIDIGETIIVNNEYATTSSPTPSCNEVTERRDLWFTFNSGNLTSVDVITEAGFNLQLWEGDCNNLTQVSNACNSVELLDIPVVPDTYYIIQVWSDTNKRPAGWLNLTVQDGLLSTPEFEFNDINIYPNPAQNELHIQSSSPIDMVQIFNLLGQQVIESKATTLDISSLTEGLYLVKVICNGSAFTYKILKH